MKKLVGILLLAWLLVLTASLLCSCSLTEHYEAHGFGDYRFSGTDTGYNSASEMDYFGDLSPLKDDFPCLECDYFFSSEEGPTYYNELERTLYFFVYSEEDYPAAKAWCTEHCEYLGDEAAEEYKAYLFYDYYGTRDKDEYYHGDDYPKAFKRVVFHDEKHVIAFVGISATDRRAEELEEALADWGLFLNRYYSDWYSFE